MAEQQLPQAGWYQDPHNPLHSRYWTGLMWSGLHGPTLNPAKTKVQTIHLDPFLDTTDIFLGASRTFGFGKAAQDSIVRSSNGEVPWFIFASGSDGALAAYERELVIHKVGAITGFMSSATGGGRVTHFPYRQISTIEFNGGFASGVLEILTSSYNGQVNKDFWTRDRQNSSGGDPRQQNNTIPMIKQHYQELSVQMARIRELMSKSHEVQVHISNSGDSAPKSLADEIAKLAELHASGLLSDEEFSAAKQKLIQG